MKKKFKVLLPDEPFCESCCDMQFPVVIIHDGNTTWCLCCANANSAISEKEYDKLYEFQQTAETIFKTAQEAIKMKFAEFQILKKIK